MTRAPALSEHCGATSRATPKLLLGQGNTPLVHGSIMTRMACGNDGYAPISLPEKIDVLPPHGPPVAFNTADVTQALAQSNPVNKSLSKDSLENQRRVLTHTQQLAAAGADKPSVPTFSSSFSTPCGGAVSSISCHWRWSSWPWRCRFWPNTFASRA